MAVFALMCSWETTGIYSLTVGNLQLCVENLQPPGLPRFLHGAATLLQWLLSLFPIYVKKIRSLKLCVCV